MAPSQATIDTALAHPIDLVTRFVARHDWLVRQQERDAIIAEIPGRWSDYQLAVSWQDGEETMQVVCRIDVRAEQAQVGEVALLAALLTAGSASPQSRSSDGGRATSTPSTAPVSTGSARYVSIRGPGNAPAAMDEFSNLASGARPGVT